MPPHGPAFSRLAATPKGVLDRLSGEIITSLRKAETVAAIEKMGFTIEVRDPAAFRPYHEQEVATWVGIAKAAKIEPEG